MVSKKKRVTKDIFQMVLKQGGTLSSPLFTVRYVKSYDLRYAVVAPKTVAKAAVMRNSLRRKGYRALENKGLNRGIYIFFYKKEAKYAPYEELQADILRLISKIRF